MANILNIGVSALTAFQRQMNTTGHNIANVSTPGYSRQVNDFVSRPAQGSGAGFVGTGVNIAATERQYDSFLSGRVRTFTSSQQEYEVFYARALQVDDVILDASSGINNTMQNFFNAVQDVADDPTSVPARQVMLNQANLLSDRFNSLDNWLDDLRRQTNQGMETVTDELNGLAASIAGVNTEIVAALGSFSGQPPNDLLDQRDQLINQMSQLVSVSVVEQDDGSANVFIGSGQAMVVGGNASTLSVINNAEASDHKEIAINQVGGFNLVITDQLSGGQIGGLLRFRDQVLDSTQNSMGRVSIGLVDFFNQEHLTGMDLDGDLGGTFFSASSPEVLDNPNNTGSISVAFDNVSNLTNLDYEMDYDGATWTLRRTDTGATVPMTGLGTVVSPFVADGISIVTDGSEVAGDSYRIRPTRNGGQDIGVLVSDARDIAAADAIIPSTGVTNTGTATITDSAWVSSVATPTKLAAPITLTFNAGTNEFVGTGGPISYNPATDSGNTLSITIAGLGDFEFTMTGTPANGDTVTLSDNTGGVGDNRNALRLGGLQNDKTLIGNTASFSDAYNFMVADVGTQTRQASANMNVQNRLLDQAESAQQAVSGVNLDEEAANLVRFQQAYQAAAQVVSTANRLFDSLLGAIR